MKDKTKRSPIKERPLRNPGEQLDYDIQDLWEKASYYFFIGAALVVLTVYEWMIWFHPTTPKPWVTTLVTSAVICYSVYRIYKIKGEIVRLKMARDGEKAVGQYLDTLRKDGALVYHDIPGANFNVDHVIISAHGIFVIETKTYSKPQTGQARISVMDDTIRVNGNTPDRNPLTQARSLAQWIGNLIQDSTGKKFPIRPVVLFPGWYVDKVKTTDDVWVLNPKALPVFVKNEPIKLKDEEVHLIAYHLSRYVRTANTSKATPN